MAPVTDVSDHPPVSAGKLHSTPVSFDIHLQAFARGAAASRDGGPVRRLLLDHAVRHEPAHGFVDVRHGDGAAEVYGVPEEGASLDGLMFTHVSGGAFDLLVRVARTADLVVLPGAAPTCVVAEHQVHDLPAELRATEVVVVHNGRELVEVIERS